MHTMLISNCTFQLLRMYSNRCCLLNVVLFAGMCGNDC